LAHGIAVDAARHPFAVLALQKLGNTAGELHHLQAAGDRALGVLDDFAVLAGDDLCQLV